MLWERVMKKSTKVPKHKNVSNVPNAQKTNKESPSIKWPVYIIQWDRNLNKKPSMHLRRVLEKKNNSKLTIKKQPNVWDIWANIIKKLGILIKPSNTRGDSLIFREFKRIKLVCKFDCTIYINYHQWYDC
jgi:hypothetical protein